MSTRVPFAARSDYFVLMRTMRSRPYLNGLRGRSPLVLPGDVAGTLNFLIKMIDLDF